MNINQNLFITGLLAISLTLSSCLETHVTNKVNSDGSVLRTVVCTSDDIDDFDFSEYPVPVDETWQKEVTFKFDSIENDSGLLVPDTDTIWVYTYEKMFDNSDVLNEAYTSGKDRFNHTKRTVEFKKQFRWFYSNILFSEKVESLIEGIDPEEYFTAEEFEVFNMQDHERITYINHADSVQRKTFVEHVEAKTEEWMTESLIVDYVKRLADYADSTQGSLDAGEVMEKQNNLTFTIEGESGLKEVTELAFDGDLKELFGDDIDLFFNDTERFYEQLFDVTGSGYTMDFAMPGALTNANGAIIDANLVRWSVETEKFFAVPYIMKAESRVMNIWAWIVSAVFVVFVFIGLFKGKRN